MRTYMRYTKEYIINAINEMSKHHSITKKQYTKIWQRI